MSLPADQSWKLWWYYLATLGTDYRPPQTDERATDRATPEQRLEPLLKAVELFRASTLDWWPIWDAFEAGADNDYLGQAQIELHGQWMRHCIETFRLTDGGQASKWNCAKLLGVRGEDIQRWYSPDADPTAEIGILERWWKDYKETGALPPNIENNPVQKIAFLILWWFKWNAIPLPEFVSLPKSKDWPDGGRAIQESELRLMPHLEALLMRKWYTHTEAWPPNMQGFHDFCTSMAKGGESGQPVVLPPWMVSPPVIRGNYREPIPPDEKRKKELLNTYFPDGVRTAGDESIWRMLLKDGYPYPLNLPNYPLSLSNEELIEEIERHRGILTALQREHLEGRGGEVEAARRRLEKHCRWLAQSCILGMPDAEIGAFSGGKGKDENTVRRALNSLREKLGIVKTVK